MSMLFAMIVLCTAIIGFFSKEFIHFFTWLFSIPGVRLVAPLMAVSLVAESYVLWGLWSLSSIRTLLNHIEHHISHLLPFQSGVMFVARVILLTILACIPMWIAQFAARRKPISNALYYARRVSAVVWVISTILLITIERG